MLCYLDSQNPILDCKISSDPDLKQEKKKKKIIKTVEQYDLQKNESYLSWNKMAKLNV